jgi:hypothetical protein
MALEDREKWDRRHAEAHAAQEPSSFLKEIFQSDYLVDPARESFGHCHRKGTERDLFGRAGL